MGDVDCVALGEPQAETVALTHADAVRFDDSDGEALTEPHADREADAQPLPQAVDASLAVVQAVADAGALAAALDDGVDEGHSDADPVALKHADAVTKALGDVLAQTLVDGDNVRHAVGDIDCDALSVLRAEADVLTHTEAEAFDDSVGVALAEKHAELEPDVLAHDEAEWKAVGLTLTLALVEGDVERHAVGDAVCDELTDTHVEADALAQIDADPNALAEDDAVHVDPHACRRAVFWAHPAHAIQ